jgi:hypothetical protein
LVGFRNLVGVGIAPVSKKTAVKKGPDHLGPGLGHLGVVYINFLKKNVKV